MDHKEVFAKDVSISDDRLLDVLSGVMEAQVVKRSTTKGQRVKPQSMKQVHLIHIALAIFIVLIGGIAPAFAQSSERPAVHVEIVLDSSGSMKSNDPSRLSILGAMIFADLSDEGDLLGLRSMKQPSYTIEPLQAVGKNRDVLRKSAKGMAYKGGTDCVGPLRVAAEALEKSRQSASGAKQFVVFLSDGVCPEDPQTLKEATVRLARNGVQIFAIGLINPDNDAPNPEKVLIEMAKATGGDYFQATKASDLPKRFADILGRIVGSEAVELDFAPGRSSEVSLDGYVRDAALIVTGPRAVRVTRANGPDGKSIGIKNRPPPYADQGTNFLTTADTSQFGQHYTVVRLDEPAFGGWDFIIDAPSGASALLIQNYALEPRLEPVEESASIGDKARFSCHLEGAKGKKLIDPNFLEKVGVELELMAPDGSATTLEMTRSNRDFTYEAEWKSAGRYRARARAFMKAGGLNKRTPYVDVVVIDQDIAFSTTGPIDLGDVKAGSTTAVQTVSLGKSRLIRDLNLTLETRGIPGVDPTPNTAKITPDNQDISLAFSVAAEHLGGPVEGELVVSVGSRTTSLPVRAVVLPVTFWEKWGEFIILVSSALGLLLLLIFIVYGVTSPFSFSPEAVLRWGNSVDRLKKNHSIIVEMEGTRRGFYRNAKLVIGGSTSSLPIGGTEVAELEASGVNQVTIRALGGGELLRVNKFDADKTKPIDEGSTGMSSGETFRIGELYIRLE